MPRKIEIGNIARLKFDKKRLGLLVESLDNHFRAPAGALGINFVSHAVLANMHGEYCGDPTPTDIITFPLGQDDIWGELYISPQAAKNHVQKNGGSFDLELRRYVIHGYLHLLGYDDLTPKGRSQMRRLERKGLSLLPRWPAIFRKK